MHDEQSTNHISLKERYAYIDVQKSPTTQDAFWPIPGLISCAGVAGSWGLLSHAHIQLETVAGVSVMTCLKRPGYKASKDSLVHTYERLGYKASKNMECMGTCATCSLITAWFSSRISLSLVVRVSYTNGEQGNWNACTCNV